MSKASFRIGTVVRVAFLVLLGLIALGEPVLALIFFIPVAGWLIWRDQDRIAELEKKLAASESPAQSKSEEA